MANKRLELDVRIQQIADEEFSDFEKYLPTKQDVAVYRRKRREYWERVNARVKEELNDGRADDAASGNN